MIDEVPIVRAEGLDRYFPSGSTRMAALRAVTFTVGPAAQIGLIGPSGSGKSTLLALIAGLDRPDGGVIAWPGLGRAGGRPACVAVAFQMPSLIPSLDVLENVSLPSVLSGETPDSAFARAQTALAMFRVDHLAAKLPEQVSAGQAQRVVLARAVAARPKLLLADEPTGQLDRKSGMATIQALLQWSRAERCAIVVATHDPLIVSQFSTVWTLEHGGLGEGSGPRLAGSAA